MSKDNQLTGTRSLGVSMPGTMPNSSYNGAITTGDPCLGGHCAIPTTPTVSNYINNNLLSANPPPGANTQYVGTNRLGNNTMEMPGIQSYIGTQTNSGPFNIQCGSGINYNFIINPSTNRKVSIFGKIGQKVLANYIREIQLNI